MAGSNSGIIPGVTGAPVVPGTVAQSGTTDDAIISVDQFSDKGEGVAAAADELSRVVDGEMRTADGSDLWVQTTHVPQKRVGRWSIFFLRLKHMIVPPENPTAEQPYDKPEDSRMKTRRRWHVMQMKFKAKLAEAEELEKSVEHEDFTKPDSLEVFQRIMKIYEELSDVAYKMSLGLHEQYESLKSAANENGGGGDNKWRNEVLMESNHWRAQAENSFKKYFLGTRIVHRDVKNLSIDELSNIAAHLPDYLSVILADYGREHMRFGGGIAGITAAYNGVSNVLIGSGASIDINWVLEEFSLLEKENPELERMLKEEDDIYKPFIDIIGLYQHAGNSTYARYYITRIADILLKHERFIEAAEWYKGALRTFIETPILDQDDNNVKGDLVTINTGRLQTLANLLAKFVSALEGGELYPELAKKLSKLSQDLNDRLEGRVPLGLVRKGEDDKKVWTLDIPIGNLGEDLRQTDFRSLLE